MPKPDMADGLGAEGGDVLVFDNTIFIENSGIASNKNGMQWLRSLASNFDYSVIGVPLHPTILHLDYGLASLERV